MKKMMIVLAVSWMLMLLFVGCQDITVGYLFVENARYVPDSLVIKKVLDTESVEIEVRNDDYYDEELRRMYMEYLGCTLEELLAMYEEMGIFPTRIELQEGEDAQRARLGYPWTSTAIQGIDGTKPIFASIKSVRVENGDEASVLKLLEYMSMRGDGTFSLPIENDIPVGKYVISLTFANEGYSRDVDDCFTIIVK